MPSIRLLDLANLVALSPSKHFFNRLLSDHSGPDSLSCCTSAACCGLVARKKNSSREPDRIGAPL